MTIPVVSKHISRVLAADPATVVAFAGDPARLASWASGLARNPVRVDGDRLLVESPMGDVVVRFVPPNDLGVLDHDVTLPDGTTTTNHLRAIAHPDGTEVVFTLRWTHDTEAEFERDAATIAEDLARLADLVEQHAGRSG